METYDKFINNILEARGRFNCGEEYHERHHITPRCLGGTDNNDNLIDLFAKEHFIAHKLLAQENPNNEKLVYAWWMMAHVENSYQEHYELTPEEYEEARISFSKTHSNQMMGNGNPRFGVVASDETRDKIRNALIGKYRGENSPNYGKQHSEETKRKISEKTKERLKKPENNPWYGISRYGEDNPNFGHRWSDEMKKKLSDSRSGEKSHCLKSVVCLDTNIIYKGVIFAEEETGIYRCTIAGCCRGDRKTAGGFRWRYIYDTNKRDGTVIPGAITLGLITEEEALKQLEGR